MIDLSYKPKKNKDEEPLGLVILGVMPFCAMIVWGVLHGLGY